MRSLGAECSPPRTIDPPLRRPYLLSAPLQEEAHVEWVATAAHSAGDLRAHLDHVGLLLAEHLLDGVGDDHPLADRRHALAERLGPARRDDGQVELVRLFKDGKAVVEATQTNAPFLTGIVQLGHA